MIHEILPPEKCAECKGCCVFDDDDYWESPAPLLPPVDGIMSCSRLTENGCGLGARKPLECALYPFRVMRLGGYRVIGLCRYCKAVAELPLSRLTEFVGEKAGEFLSLADGNPEIVKDYNGEYIILYVHEQ